jgi:multidrug efflux pump
MLSRFFIDRPIFAVVVSVVITLAGAIAVRSLPIAQYPQITPPSVSVSISYPGASAQVVAETVAAPIEQSVNGVEGMLYMSSNSGSDGSYSLSVTFEVGTDLNTALVMVQNRVTLAMPLLPSSVQNQGITIRKKTPDMLMIISLYTIDPGYTNIDLSNFALINLKDELLRVDGVSDVNIMGEKDYSIRIWLDPQQLASRNLTAIDAATAVRNQNIPAVAGQIGQQPAPRNQTIQLPIEALGRLRTPEQFREVVVAVARPSGRQAAKASGAPAITLPPTPTLPSGTSGPKSNQAGGNLAVTSVLSSDSTTSTSGTSTSGGSSSSSNSASSSGGGSTGGGAQAAGGAQTGGGATPLLPMPTMMLPTSGSPAGSSTTPAATAAPLTQDVLTSSALVGSDVQGPAPGPVRIKDVATVELGAVNYNQYATFDLHDAVGVTVYQLPGTNALDVADRVRARLKKLGATFPSWINYKIGYDTTPYIRESVADVRNTLFLAVVLVGAVVLLFLQDWRAMILPMIDVPVSLIGTFAVMAILGYSLNNISLFGLVLAIGIVVDDAIVVLENIERQMAQGLDARTATIKAMEEITGPIIAITLVLCAVFVPCAFLSGISGRFFRQFAVTISASMIISAVNALTMTPSRALAIFRRDEGRGLRDEGGSGASHPSSLNPHPSKEALPWWIFGIGGGMLTVWLGPWLARPLGLPQLPAGEETSRVPDWIYSVFRINQTTLPPLLTGNEVPTWYYWAVTALQFLPGLMAGLVVGWFVIRPVNAVLGRLFRGFNRAFDRMTAGYGSVVRLLLRGNALVLLAYAGLLVLTIWVFRNSKTGFVPEQDQGRLIASLQLPDATALEHTKRVLADVEKIAHEFDAVADTITNAGSSFMAGANAPNYGTMFVILKPFGERPSAQVVRTQLQKAYDRRIREGKVTMAGTPSIPGLSVSGGFKLMVEDQVGLGLDVLQQQTEKLIAALIKHEPGLEKKITTTLRSNNPQLFLEIDRDRVMAMGVALPDVNQTLEIYLGSSFGGNFNEFGRHWQVTLQAQGKFRSQLEDVGRLQVRNKLGQMVPLSALVTVQPKEGALGVPRYNLHTVAPVMGNITFGYSSGEVIAGVDEIARNTLSPGIGTEWTELMYLQIHEGNTTLAVFGLGVLCVFLALAALYESWTMPLAVILVVPLCVLCSLLGVWVSGGSVDIFVQIGLVVLVGLACKNAILVVEFAQQLHKEGQPRMEAALEAARLRLRPILMTSFAFIVGVAPLTVATGAGAEMRRSLGMAVFSGMIGVTVFGIFLTPVFFFVIQGLGDWAGIRSVRWQRVASTVAGGLLGALGGWLLTRIGVGTLPWGPLVAAAIGAVLVPIVIEALREKR